MLLVLPHSKKCTQRFIWHVREVITAYGLPVGESKVARNVKLEWQSCLPSRIWSYIVFI